MRILTSLLLAAVLAIPLALSAQAESARLVVIGEGRVDGRPDMATLTLGVTTQAVMAAPAMAANSSQLSAVLEQLRAAGIAERDLQTSGLSLNPIWDHSASGGAPQIRGYVASNMLSVRIRELDVLGEVLDAAVRDGANSFNGLAFGLSDPAPAMDEARRRAVADARHKAGILAEAAGVTLGAVVSIAEGGGNQPAPMFRLEASMADGAIPVAEGEVSLMAQVTMIFEITN